VKLRLALVTCAAVLFLWQLGGHDLWAPDEPYFGEGAREMVVDGEWWVPHVNGVVTTDKPPLFFWSIAALSLPGGEVNGWTARLPSALAALGTLLLVAWIARRRRGEAAAWLVIPVLATTLMFWDKARWAQIDSLLCCLIWVALTAFEAWRAGEARGARAGLLFWAAAGLAVLAKGPVGLLLPLGIALATLATDRRLGEWRRFAPLAGPALFAALVGGWMLAATLAVPEYSVWGALREHFLERGLHGMHHRQPPWYYLTVLPVHLLPWSGLVPAALLLAWRRRDATDRFLLVVAAFVVLFFSVSTEKRDLYVLPAVPAFALMVSSFLSVTLFGWHQPGEEGLREERAAPPVGRRWLRAGQAVVGALLALVGAALPFVAARQDLAGDYGVAGWMVGVFAATLVLAGLVTLWGCLRSPRTAALAPAAAFVVLYLFAATWVYPVLEPSKSSRPFAQRLAAATADARAAGEPVLTYDLSNLPEAFAFYGDGLYTVPAETPAAISRHLDQPGEAWAVIRAPVLDEVEAVVGRPLRVVAADHLSRRDVLLVTNAAPPGAP